MVFGTALSGIQAASKDLEVTGNNIANAGTIGFKSSRAEFADVYANNFYGSGSMAIGSGVRLASITQAFDQGDFTYTNSGLDLAISGGGLFILDTDGARSYTRAGSFELDKNGFLVNGLNHAQKVIGLPADANGNIGTLSGPLQISSANIAPKATTGVGFGVNLLASSTIRSVDWVGGASPADDTYNNKVSSVVYDSLGNSHTLNAYYILADAAAAAGSPNASSPPGTQNQWYVAYTLDGQNVPANVGADNTSNLFRMNFNSDGSFAGTQDVTNTPLPGNLMPLNLVLTNGALPLNINVDMSVSTQFGSPFATQSISQDGYTTGKINDLNISETGVITGSYTNGQTRALGQIQLANFTNLGGLQSLGNSAWGETNDSGQALIGISGTAGLGLLTSGAVEASNVNLTNELVNLIQGQRNFQANAQTIRTADAVTQTIINIR